MRPPSARGYGRIFRWPAVLAAMTLVGLVVGLLGDGWYDGLAWIGLGVPVLICAWALCRRPRARR